MRSPERHQGPNRTSDDGLIVTFEDGSIIRLKKKIRDIQVRAPGGNFQSLFRRNRTQREYPDSGIGARSEKGERIVSERSLDGHTYLVQQFSRGISWSEARKLAERRGGHLVTIGSSRENDLVCEMILEAGTRAGDYQGGAYAIGLHDPDRCGHWEWVTGEPVGFTHWGWTEPNNRGRETVVAAWARPDWEGRWNDTIESYPWTGCVIEFE